MHRYPLDTLLSFCFWHKSFTRNAFTASFCLLTFWFKIVWITFLSDEKHFSIIFFLWVSSSLFGGIGTKFRSLLVFFLLCFLIKQSSYCEIQLKLIKNIFCVSFRIPFKFKLFKTLPWIIYLNRSEKFLQPSRNLFHLRLKVPGDVLNKKRVQKNKMIEKVITKLNQCRRLYIIIPQKCIKVRSGETEKFKNC